MQEIMSYISQYGFGIVLLAYFIIKDAKWTSAIITMLSEIKSVLTELRTSYEKDHNARQ